LLVFNGQRDRRAIPLGATFLVLAAASSDRLFFKLTQSSDWLQSVVDVLSHLHPDAFLPLFFWLFFRDFPRASTRGRAHTIARIGIGSTAVAGIVLFAIHAAPLLMANDPSSKLFSYLHWFRPSTSLYLYTWVIVIGLILPALVFAIWRIRAAPVQERRRVSLFLAGFWIGSGPMLLTIVLGALIPEVRDWLDEESNRWFSSYVLRPFLLTIPVTTAYSVLVYHVLDVKLVVRRAIRYALARYAVLAATAIPFIGLILYLYGRRDQTISELLSGFRPILLIAATVFGLAVFRLRKKVLALIDRHFFREQYDSRQILLSLAEGSRRVASPDELADLLSVEIDRALHVEAVCVLILNHIAGELQDREGQVPSLSMASPLAHLLNTQAHPFEADPENPESPIHSLPAEARDWLTQTGFRFLVPLLGMKGSLIGLAALGGKKSELPFSSEDRLLLSTIAASAALSLESHLGTSPAGPDWPTPAWSPRTREAPHIEPVSAEDLANECRGCHRIEPRRGTRCPTCGGALKPTGLPYVLLGKFRFEQRIGAGGMGVVYRALDLDLGRKVAIKTMPEMSAGFATRLRQEARVMARVAHPNLALIYGVETWRGTPLLIVEYLEGGTLADRLRREKLELGEATQLGITLAGVLETMHAAGVLHRDIKPSNVGYGVDGSPKLLDLGLAKILDDSQRVGAPVAKAVLADLDAIPDSKLTSLTVTRRVVGTPVYLSPEAARGEEPDPSFDLWSLAIMLFEAFTGIHPLLFNQKTSLRRRILNGEVANIRQLVPDCPSALELFFDNALSAELRRRPSSARDLIERLEAVRVML
jgi:hypothetical protein